MYDIQLNCFLDTDVPITSVSEFLDVTRVFSGTFTIVHVDTGMVEIFVYKNKMAGVHHKMSYSLGITGCTMDADGLRSEFANDNFSAKKLAQACPNSRMVVNGTPLNRDFIEHLQSLGIPTVETPLGLSNNSRLSNLSRNNSRNNSRLSNLSHNNSRSNVSQNNSRLNNSAPATPAAEAAKDVDEKHNDAQVAIANVAAAANTAAEDVPKVEQASIVAANMANHPKEIKLANNAANVVNKNANVVKVSNEKVQDIAQELAEILEIKRDALTNGNITSLRNSVRNNYPNDGNYASAVGSRPEKLVEALKVAYAKLHEAVKNIQEVTEEAHVNAPIGNKKNLEVAANAAVKLNNNANVGKEEVKNVSNSVKTLLNKLKNVTKEVVNQKNTFGDSASNFRNVFKNGLGAFNLKSFPVSANNGARTTSNNARLAFNDKLALGNVHGNGSNNRLALNNGSNNRLHSNANIPSVASLNAEAEKINENSARIMSARDNENKTSDAHFMKILGINKRENATASFRRLALKVHPNKGGNASMFRNIKNARNHFAE